MKDNNVIDLADRRDGRRPAIWGITSERVTNLAMQAMILPTTLSLSEIEILGAAILGHNEVYPAVRPSS